MLKKKVNLLWLVALAIALFVPNIITNPAYRQIAVITLIFTACATSWNMFSGYSGYVALGSAAFYGTGAYTMALLSLHLHVHAGGDMAIPIGLIALRVRRHTFVVITIAIFFVFQLAAINFGFTGGTGGLTLPYIPWMIQSYHVPFYYVALTMLVFAIALSASVRR